MEAGKKLYKLDDNFDFYIALCGLFPPKRNIIKRWSLNEDTFVELVRSEGQQGIEHFMQALVLYFVRKYNDKLSKYAPTFMKKLVDESIISEKFLLQWNDKTIRLDKDGSLYDKKAEKKFRD